MMLTPNRCGSLESSSLCGRVDYSAEEMSLDCVVVFSAQ